MSNEPQESIFENFSKKELDAFNQGLDAVIDIIEARQKAYKCTGTFDNNYKINALDFVKREIKDIYV